LKDRKYNGKKKEHKRRNNDRQNINLLKSAVNSGASERLSVPEVLTVVKRKIMEITTYI
jgi:hypothetical protein